MNRDTMPALFLLFSFFFTPIRWHTRERESARVRKIIIKRLKEKLCNYLTLETHKSAIIFLASLSILLLAFLCVCVFFLLNFFSLISTLKCFFTGEKWWEPIQYLIVRIHHCHRMYRYAYIVFFFFFFFSEWFTLFCFHLQSVFSTIVALFFSVSFCIFARFTWKSMENERIFSVDWISFRALHWNLTCTNRTTE